MDERRLERLLAALHRTDASTSVLERLCVVCAESGAADGAGMSRVAASRHEVLAASDERARSVEILQETLREGPCVEVMGLGRPFLEPDLRSSAARDRWPRFALAALDHGVAAVFAFPLIAGSEAFGALDLYCAEPRELRAGQFEDALLVADLAALAVNDETTEIPDVGLATEGTESWAYPGVVHQATGMISERLGIPVDEALLRLRAAGFVGSQSVVDVARAVVERRLQIESWAEDD